MKWTVYDIPHQTGRLAIVTGANTGIGFELQFEKRGYAPWKAYGANQRFTSELQRRMQAADASVVCSTGMVRYCSHPRTRCLHSVRLPTQRAAIAVRTA